MHGDGVVSQEVTDVPTTVVDALDVARVEIARTTCTISSVEYGQVEHQVISHPRYGQLVANQVIGLLGMAAILGGQPMLAILEDLPAHAKVQPLAIGRAVQIAIAMAIATPLAAPANPQEIKYGYCEVTTYLTGTAVKNWNNEIINVRKLYLTQIVSSERFGESLPDREEGPYGDDFLAHVSSIKPASERIGGRPWGLERPHCMQFKTRAAAERARETHLTWKGKPEGTFLVQGTDYVFPAKPTAKPPLPGPSAAAGLLITPIVEDRRGVGRS